MRELKKTKEVWPKGEKMYFYSIEISVEESRTEELEKELWKNLH